MAGWKDVLKLLERFRKGLSASHVADALGCTTHHARVLLERCRQMGTVRFVDLEERPRRYELSEYGLRRVHAGFKRIGKWKS